MSVESPRGACFGKKCPHMSWLVEAVIERDYPLVLPEQKAQIAEDETDYASRECQGTSVCLAESKWLHGEGVTQDA